MAEVIKRNKALSVKPLKSSQPLGACLAFLGIYKAMPLMHGSQGCTAFGKVFFVRHFREPIPLQTTALDQVTTIMNPDQSIVEGLRTIADKQKPHLIGLVTTGLTETQGTDIQRAVKNFYQEYPDLQHIKVVAVNTPDFTGCLETGFAKAIEAMMSTLVPQLPEDEASQAGMRLKQVNVLCSSMLTPGDIETLSEIIQDFGLRPLLIPELGDSLDGHVTENKFEPLTVGGTDVTEFETLGQAKASLIIGQSLYKAADILHKKTKVPDYRFDSLLGLQQFDAFLMALQDISGVAVPEKYNRQRAQLQDAMLDAHFMLGQAKVGIAGDMDEIYSMSNFLVSMGAEIVAAVTPTSVNNGIIEKMPFAHLKIGDLEDLEKLAEQHQAELIIGNSHTVSSAEKLGIPVLRMGFPQYDLLGGYQRTWIGYKATRQALFDIANLLLEYRGKYKEIKPYLSYYAQKPEYKTGSYAVS